MSQRYRHIVVYFLLCSYLLLGVVGYLETLVLSGFGTNPQLFTQSKNSPPPETKTYWTQYKHIPSVVKISVPSPVIFTPPESLRVFIVGIAFPQYASSNFSDPSFSLHSSRAPPQI
jgi:hypothetical protein